MTTTIKEANHEDDDWKEGSNQESCTESVHSHQDPPSFDDELIDAEVQSRKDYVVNMKETHGKEIDQEIRKRESEDLNLRDFKSNQNTDKLKDFMHIKQQRAES